MAPRKGSTIGSNPLDQVVPLRAPEPEPSPMVSTARERLTVSLPVELVERARNAVWWTPGATLAGMVEDALAERLDGLEAENGGAFKGRRANLKPGRRMK